MSGLPLLFGAALAGAGLGVALQHLLAWRVQASLEGRAAPAILAALAGLALPLAGGLALVQAGAAPLIAGAAGLGATRLALTAAAAWKG